MCLLVQNGLKVKVKDFHDLLPHLLSRRREFQGPVGGWNLKPGP